MPLQFNFSFIQVVRDYNVNTEDIEELKVWMKRENLPEFIEEQILVFFISCDKNLEATKATIKSNVSLVAKMPELFANRNPYEAHIQQYLSISTTCVLPERTEDGCVIIYAKLTDLDYKKYDFAACFAVWIMVLESGIYDYPPTGCIFLSDCYGLTIMHLSKVQLHLIKPLSQYFQESLQTKLKAVHLLNSSWVLEKFVTLIKPVVKSDIFNKIHLHTGCEMETFKKFNLPKRCLPLEFGGVLPSVNVLYQKQIEKLQSLKDYFYYEEQLRKNFS